MDETLYDEFGNYIGPDLDDDDDVGNEQDNAASFFSLQSNGGSTLKSGSLLEDNGESDGSSMSSSGDDHAGEASTGALVPRNGRELAVASDAIVLHEDKEYYPEAEDIYGSDTEVTFQEVDTQTLQQPIIAPVVSKSFSVLEMLVPQKKCSEKFMMLLSSTPSLIRNVAFVGHIHHGKTTVGDLLVEATHQTPWSPEKSVRYLDTRKDEQERRISIKVSPASLVLPDMRGKHYLLNVADCPGHVDFSDEASAALRISDGAVVVVDALEGVMLNTKRMIRHAVAEKVAIALCISKVDRLVHELKLPPADAYHKLVHTIESVNEVISSCGVQNAPVLSPECGNVCFSSAAHGWCFSLESFAKIYSERYFGGGVKPAAFAKRLWGDRYYDESTGKFLRSPASSGAKRSFVHFILEPLYKIYAQVLGEESKVLARTLKSIHVKLTKEELYSDAKPLLKIVLSRFFGGCEGFVSMLVQHIPSPLDNAAKKVEHAYRGDISGRLGAALTSCDAKGPLMVHIAKMYSSPDASTFSALGRVYSGTLLSGQEVKVMGEMYSPEDDEDMIVRTVSSTALPHGRHRSVSDRIAAGNWVMIDGISATISRTATVADVDCPHDVDIFRPLSFIGTSTVKLSVEPLIPSELPKMLHGLRSVSKSYPLLRTKVEESGEHVIYGTGEMYLDCAMHDLRTMYSEIEIKVTDPMVGFRETVIETSAFKCSAESVNKKNKLTMIAGPLEDGIAKDIEAGAVSMKFDPKDVGKFFRKKYNWDILAARSIWAFGPEEDGPNMLLDDTLPGEVDKSLVKSIRGSVVQGFKWGCKEGPLCDEPLRNVKFRMLDCNVASELIHRGGGQIIPAARKASYSSFLVATPKIMEPVHYVEVQTTPGMTPSVQKIIQKRRGHIVKEEPIPGTPFFRLNAYVPVIDSFGFETDIRGHTQGQAFCQSVFDHWNIAPGDPLDTSIALKPLEPSPASHLAREFVLKTRRRKGLGDQITVAKFFEDPELRELAEKELSGKSMTLLS